MKNAMIKSVFAGVVLVAGVTTGFAQAQSGSLDAANDIFNNTATTPTGGLAMTNGEEVGNEIFGAGNANDNYMTNFTFEYFGTSGGSASASSFSGNVQVKINFYVNNGTSINGYLSPSATPFYTWNSANYTDLAGFLTPSTESAVTIGIGDPEGLSAGTSYLDGVHLLSQEFTYTITFTGLDPSLDTIGLSSVPGSGIGTVYSGYWYQAPGTGTWQYLTNGVSDASITQIQAVPEPTSMALVGFGGLAMLAAAKRRFVK